MNPVGKIVVVGGPTASGKSALGVEIARAIHGEVLSADSMQIYRGLDVGTAKPTKSEMGGIIHHGIDIADPSEPFGTGAFCQYARPVIQSILGRGMVPVVVGGTGLWLKALIHGLAEIPAIEPQLRAAVRAEIESRGPEALWRDLYEVDPDYAARIEKTDPQRIGRALEVFRATGKTFSSFHSAHGFQTRFYNPLYLVISVPREERRARIEARVHKMLGDGLVEEVRKLYDAGCDSLWTSMRGLGYRQLLQHFQGELSREEAVEQIVHQTRQFSKRQVLWFRKQSGVCELPFPVDVAGAITRVQSFLSSTQEYEEAPL